ncbi:MAG: MetQ/NlpA family ABC transporter substrate-binding protein [Clostridia bacterium]|nr:MetQ/NlpA family ABC transporter substrate-binding protein [Clostridia bacterium]
MKKIIALALTALLLAGSLVSCGASDGSTIKVAATSTPHAEVLEVCKEAMAEKGFTLEIMVVDDYVTPNNATESGDVDANYFQHQQYLDSFNAENGTHLVTVANVHYEPYAIYAGTRSSLDALQDGDAIAVPNDPTNEARALQLLADQGLITLKEGAGLTATKNDIVENPKNLDIKEMEAALLPDQLDEVAMAVINGNYALAAGLDVNTSLAMESTDSEAALTYVNVLVVKEGNENNEAVKALAEVITSDVVREYMSTTYGNAVVPMF